ncbi:MAG: 4'-phosphopantetheinyl transferase superfamily protein [Bosea sp.]|uniref:4'-phosphopantetheinyl transferase family protein n=1 Tax=unclassified Bosea (in: a-proteobacteria) TaxID=2653178 RepID=UPI001AD41906|nr:MULTISPECIES: 4'-phosphopantetheinyl transferase superfamily protein [unclassified Bosea (in: a-proteobacteria)]MBN9456865.1 4'-phosphopantetheinyl transferase superfamily protein [Bosea sp. (in: a-proteobacteria)]
MHWLQSIAAIAPGLPAAWLVQTPQQPRSLPERSQMRRRTACTILARQLGCSEAEIAVAHDEAGRPWPTGPGTSGLHLSLATRAGAVAVALAERPVGIDIERAEPDGAIPRAMLHGDEWRALQAIAPEHRPLAFARLWAAKEAYVKALGTGFARPPESFAVTLLSGAAFRVADPSRSTAVQGWLRTIENGGRETLAAAAIVLDDT